MEDILHGHHGARAVIHAAAELRVELEVVRILLLNMVVQHVQDQHQTHKAATLIIVQVC